MAEPESEQVQLEEQPEEEQPEPEEPTVVSVRDVDATKLVEAYARQLKKRGEITLPLWVDYVKTGHAKQLPPKNPDWFFVRCASIARKLYLHPNHGLNWLASQYSTRKNRGSKPEHVFSASRTVIRRCLKEMEKIGIARSHTRKGRSLTVKGRKELDELANQIYPYN